MAFSDFASTFSRRGGHYDPDQPRVPAGHPDGGQWTPGPGGEAPNETKDIHRWSEIFEQAAAEGLGVAAANPDDGEMRGDSGAVRRWLEIFRLTALERFGLAAAERRGRRGGGGRSPWGWIIGGALEGLFRLIEKYRQENSDPQLRLKLEDKDTENSPEDERPSTVAVTIFDRKPKFGVNSTHHDYNRESESLRARQWLATLARKYPTKVKTDNIGEKPNDALYHAEATLCSG